MMIGRRGRQRQFSNIAATCEFFLSFDDAYGLDPSSQSPRSHDLVSRPLRIAVGGKNSSCLSDS
jgi:hypothetical protein